jgi:HK97 gp10 family phage protein
MSVTVKGLNKVLMDLEKQLGEKVVDHVANEALTLGAKEFAKELEKEFEGFKDTGESIEEITVGKYENIRGLRRVRVYWHGSAERYRIIHLNEWGTVQNPKPDGFGAIARAMDNSKAKYKKVTEDTVRKYIS